MVPLAGFFRGTDPVAASARAAPDAAHRDAAFQIDHDWTVTKTADLFPGRHLGAILGVITIGAGIGSAVGSWAAGWIFDISGSYRLAFLLAIASYLGGCVAFWTLRDPPRRTSI